MSTNPIFPPLFSGLPTEADPFEFAQDRAQNGCDAGLVVHNLKAHALKAAIVFAPDVALEEGTIMLPICGIGFQNALGALAPPEIAVHLKWDGNIQINGARCGTLKVAAATNDPTAIPDWLVIGLELALWPASDDPGQTPDETALYAEGCADVDAVALLEAWVRHSLVWINRWTDEGAKPIHSEWSGLAAGLQEQVQMDGKSGNFIGVDDKFGMLLKAQETTHLIPLTVLLSGGKS